jgi:uncharacterized protein (TIGR03032 family)
MSVAPSDGDPIRCRISDGLAAWLQATTGSVVFTTYQAGKVGWLGWHNRQPTVLLRHLDRPTGLALVAGTVTQLAVAARNQVVVWADAPALAREYPPGQLAAGHDALFLPRAVYPTGDLLWHDLAATATGWVGVSTRFSCLARIGGAYALEPIWKPPFIPELAPDDSCHLNGLAVRAGRPAFVTALGTTHTPAGWRAHKATGGVVIDVASGAVVVGGLAMPHSPRWHNGQLWVLNSGHAELGVVDPGAGTYTPVCRLPGYPRGLWVGPDVALVGLCRIREHRTFGGLPIERQRDQLCCGIAVVNVGRGEVIGLLEFTAGCEELFDVGWLPGVRHPMLLAPTDETAHAALPGPAFGYWMRPSG